MTEEEIYKVVTKLIGKIQPQGESNIDKIRFENLEVLCKLTEKLIVDIDEVAYDNHERQEASMKKAGQYASKWLDRQGIED